MASANPCTPVSLNRSLFVRQCSCCVSDPVMALYASSLPALVSHGDIEAHLVSSSTLCLGMAQSYLDGKLHMTMTPATSGFCDTALNVLLAIAEFPNPPNAVHT